MSISNNTYRVNIYHLINIDSQSWSNNSLILGRKSKNGNLLDLNYNNYIEKMTHLGARAKQRRGGYC